MQKVKLLSQAELIKTGSVDHADWNYKGILQLIQRKRFQICLKLINNSSYRRLLEIGYGSGIFLPALSNFASEIYGIDTHDKNREVEQILLKNNINAKLFSASAVEIPFSNNYFDCIVAVSALEFIDDLNTACKEIKRVLKENGEFIVITPGYSFILDFGLKMLTKENAESDFANRRELIIPTLLKHFKLIQRITFPRLSNSAIRLYQGLKFYSS